MKERSYGFMRCGYECLEDVVSSVERKSLKIKELVANVSKGMWNLPHPLQNYGQSTAP